MNGARPLSTLARRAVTPLTAALALAALLLSPGQARAEDGDRQIIRLRIEVLTGGDDLRNASNAIATLKYTSVSGNQMNASINMNNGAQWPNWSSRTVNFTLPSGVLLSRAYAFRIQFYSGQPDPFATGDNWNMNSITVTGILDDGSEVILVQKAGSPLHRFQSDNWTLWETDI
jgi:hypothetical protein